jgi:hypothetical protein
MTTKLSPNIRKCNTDNAGVVTVQESTKCRLGSVSRVTKGSYASYLTEAIKKTR